MEVGPRALGNRSCRTQADARGPQPEGQTPQSFQPFAPVVLAERAGEGFRIPARSRSLDFMLFACDVRPERATRIPAVVDADGTSRIQQLRRAETNPLFHRLIAEFERAKRVCPWC